MKNLKAKLQENQNLATTIANPVHTITKKSAVDFIKAAFNDTVTLIAPLLREAGIFNKLQICISWVSYKYYYLYRYEKISCREDFFENGEKKDLAINYHGDLSQPSILENLLDESIYFQERNIKARLLFNVMPSEMHQWVEI